MGGSFFNDFIATAPQTAITAPREPFSAPQTGKTAPRGPFSAPQTPKTAPHHGTFGDFTRFRFEQSQL